MLLHTDTLYLYDTLTHISNDKMVLIFVSVTSCCQVRGITLVPTSKALVKQLRASLKQYVMIGNRTTQIFDTRAPDLARTISSSFLINLKQSKQNRCISVYESSARDGISSIFDYFFLHYILKN